MKVSTTCVSTGTPFSVAGLKIHWRAASSAAPRSRGWPLMALASVTRPSADIVTCTSTGPDMLYLLAPGGYRGWTLVITPPHDTGPNSFIPPLVAGPSDDSRLPAVEVAFGDADAAGGGSVGAGSSIG